MIERNGAAGTPGRDDGCRRSSKHRPPGLRSPPSPSAPTPPPARSGPHPAPLEDLEPRGARPRPRRPSTSLTVENPPPSTQRLPGTAASALGAHRLPVEQVKRSQPQAAGVQVRAGLVHLRRGEATIRRPVGSSSQRMSAPHPGMCGVGDIALAQVPPGGALRPRRVRDGQAMPVVDVSDSVPRRRSRRGPRVPARPPPPRGRVELLEEQRGPQAGETGAHDDESAFRAGRSGYGVPAGRAPGEREQACSMGSMGGPRVRRGGVTLSPALPERCAAARAR